MPDAKSFKENREDQRASDDENDEGETGEGRARFSMPKVILTIVALLLGAAAILMTMGPSVSPRGVVALDEAFVHGAVTHVGIAEDARIAALHVELGDVVETGDVVATLEADRLEARVREGEARVGRLEAELDRAEIANRIAQAQAESALKQAEAEVQAARAQRDAAEAEVDLEEEQFARQQDLFGKGLVPDVEVDTARERVQQARALVAQRVAELRAAEGGVVEARAETERAALRAAERDVLRERIAEADAELARVETSLSKAQIDAKDSGIVVNVASRAGSSVRPNDTIVSIWNIEQIWMLAWVPEDHVARIGVGDPAEIELHALEGQIFEGVVRRVLVSEDGEERTLPGQPISPLLPEETRFAVQVEFDPGEAALRRLLPGMSGDVRIRVDMPSEEPGGLKMLLSLIDAGESWMRGLTG